MNLELETPQHGDGQYLTTVLPKQGPALSSYIDKYRAIRLQALADSPETLSGSFEIERNLPRSHFADLVTQSRRHIIVIIQRPSTNCTREDALINGAWVGIAHILGPIPLSDWIWPNIGGLRPDYEETRWSVFNGYVIPDHRAHGEMIRRFEEQILDLCETETRRLLASRASKEGRKALALRQRAVVSPKALGLLQWYGKSGWRKAGFITAEESLRAKEPGYEYGNSKASGHLKPDHMVIERVIHISTSAADAERRIQAML